MGAISPEQGKFCSKLLWVGNTPEKTAGDLFELWRMRPQVYSRVHTHLILLVGCCFSQAWFLSWYQMCLTSPLN